MEKYYTARHRAYKKRQACKEMIKRLLTRLENLPEKEVNQILGLTKHRSLRDPYSNSMARQLFEILGNGLGDLRNLKAEIYALKTDPRARDPAKIGPLLTPVPLIGKIPLELQFSCPECRKPGVPLQCDGHWFCLHVDQLSPRNLQVPTHYVGKVILEECWILETTLGREVYTCYDMDREGRVYVAPNRLRKHEKFEEI